MMDGLHIDPAIQADVALNIVGQQAAHIARLEAAVQQLAADNAAVAAAFDQYMEQHPAGVDEGQPMNAIPSE